MTTINVGAYIDNRRAPSKAALKRALAATPELVAFDPTSAFGPSGAFNGDHIPAGAILSVVGPDPYSDRRWYATVSRTPKGIRLT